MRRLSRGVLTSERFSLRDIRSVAGLSRVGVEFIFTKGFGDSGVVFEDIGCEVGRSAELGLGCIYSMHLNLIKMVDKFLRNCLCLFF